MCIRDSFDLGGVMVDFDPKTYLVDRFCNAEVEEQVSQLTFESEEWKLLDAGLITRSEANLRMLARAKEYGRAFEAVSYTHLDVYKRQA